MQTREEAITWLRAQGLHADARDWSFGASIVVSADIERVPSPSDPEGQTITVLRNITCIHPEAEHWRVTDLSNAQPVSATYATLQEATYAAFAALAARNAPGLPS